MLVDYSRIVVPYDHSELSKKALKMAINLAKQDEKIELLVVTIFHPEIPLGYPYAHPLVNNQREVAESKHNELKEELAILPNKTRTFLLEGNPGQVILEFSKENDADLIVMGSRGLSGLKEMFLGSVSHHVVQKATCPVLIVK